ncbi:uncharacterized protein TNCV_1532261 [Trichonephila clavipes]|nr:uncharacterized protein TNCV_1532261 [Trichonephila clavipes]
MGLHSPYLQGFHWYFKSNLPCMTISLRGDVNWPACSPDLSPPDYFLWAYLKSLVYKNRSKTLEDCMNPIRAEIDNIPGRYA